jgi:hypothetical protein
LPIFRERTDWIGKALGGWQINGIWTVSSGFPYTVKIGRNLRQPSGEQYGPIRPAVYYGGALNDHGDNAFIRSGGNFPGGGTLYFDTVTSGAPGIGRNSFRGPRYRSADLSIIKQTRLPRMPGLGEDAKLDIRFNFLNAFNELNLSPIGFFSPGSFADSAFFGRADRGLAGRVVEFQARFSF